MPEKINAKFHAIVGNNDITFDGSASSFRTLGNATTSQNLLTLENGTASGAIVALREISLEMDATAVLIAVASTLRLRRASGLPSGGTTLDKVSSDTLQSSNTLVVARGATGSDGGAATAITTNPQPGSVFARFVMRMHTAVGQIVPDSILLLRREDQPIILRPGEAALIQLTNPVAANNPSTNHYVVNCRWEEYTARL